MKNYNVLESYYNGTPFTLPEFLTTSPSNYCSVSTGQYKTSNYLGIQLRIMVAGVAPSTGSLKAFLFSDMYTAGGGGTYFINTFTAEIVYAGAPNTYGNGQTPFIFNFNAENGVYYSNTAANSWAPNYKPIVRRFNNNLYNTNFVDTNISGKTAYVAGQNTTQIYMPNVFYIVFASYGSAISCYGYELGYYN